MGLTIKAEANNGDSIEDTFILCKLLADRTGASYVRIDLNGTEFHISKNADIKFLKERHIRNINRNLKTPIVH